MDALGFHRFQFRAHEHRHFSDSMFYVDNDGFPVEEPVALELPGLAYVGRRTSTVALREDAPRADTCHVT